MQCGAADTARCSCPCGRAAGTSRAVGCLRSGAPESRGSGSQGGGKEEKATATAATAGGGGCLGWQAGWCGRECRCAAAAACRGGLRPAEPCSPSCCAHLLLVGVLSAPLMPLLSCTQLVATQIMPQQPASGWTAGGAGQRAGGALAGLATPRWNREDQPHQGQPRQHQGRLLSTLLAATALDPAELWNSGA